MHGHAHAHRPSHVHPSLAVRLGLDSGVRRLLDTPISINGAVGSTVLRWLGSQASAAGWVEYGGAGSLSLQTGTAPSYQQPTPFLGADDLACRFNAGGYYSSGSNTLCNPGTDDIVFEIVAVAMQAADNIYYGTSVRPANTNVWEFAVDAGAWRGYYYGTSNQAAASPSISHRALYICHVIYRYGQYVTIYADGVAGTPASLSAVGAITQAAPLCIGARTNGTIPVSGSILYAAWHQRASWLDSHLQPTLVAERMALLYGSRPAYSAVPSTYPSSAGSSSPVHQTRRMTDGTDRVFYMGPGAPCYLSTVDASGRAVVAHMVEAAQTNVALQSQAAGTTWTTSAASVTTNTATAPDGETTADTLTATAAGGYLRQTFASISAVERVYSHWVRRAGSSDVAGRLRIVQTSTGTVIAETSFSAGSSWRRVSVRGTSVLNDTEIRCVLDVSGTSIYVWQADFTDADCAGSEIVTTTASTTRAASVCRYAAGGVLPRAECTLVAKILCLAFTPSRARVLLSLSDGTTSNEIQVFTTAATGRLSARSRKSGGTSGDVESAGSLYDGYARPIMVSLRQGSLRLWARSPSGVWTYAEDTSVDAIAGSALTTISIGHDGAGANQAGPGAYVLAGWQLIDRYIAHPSEARSAVDSSWGGM